MAIQPALDLITPVLDFAVKNPWVLIPLLVPIMNLWLALIRFEAGDIVVGSLAAAIQSYIGNVSSGLLFAFLLNNEAGGFARAAISMAGVWLVNAALLAAVGKVLIEQGMKNEDVAGQIWDALPVVLPL